MIFGQDEVIDQTLITLLSGGHVLLVGVPGLGKSRLVETLGVVLGLATKRIQFTPDLMPADIVGSEVLDETEGRRAFRFVPGPVFCQLLMADEINRASPRTQSALLQAMQEQRVAIGGVEHACRARSTYWRRRTRSSRKAPTRCPKPSSTASCWRSTSATPTWTPNALCCSPPPVRTDARPVQAMSADDLVTAQALVRRLPVGEKVVDAILSLVRGCRPETAADDIVRRHVAWGPGPRAAQALMLASRARALLGGRLAPSIDDVVALGAPGAAASDGTEFFGTRRRHRAAGRDRPAGREAWVAPCLCPTQPALWLTPTSRLNPRYPRTCHGRASRARQS